MGFFPYRYGRDRTSGDTRRVLSYRTTHGGTLVLDFPFKHGTCESNDLILIIVKGVTHYF
jgi:hypothetical protein